MKKIIPWQDLGIDAIYEAEDGQRGLALMDQYLPSIVISDIKMPHMNGMDFIRNVRDRFPEVLVVFLSGHTDKEYLKGAIDLHVDGYIEKPLNPKEITALMQKLVASCKEKEKIKNPRIYFFHAAAGSYPLNDKVFTLSKRVLHEFDHKLLQKDTSSSMSLLKSLLFEIRQCEATMPDYVRNVFSRLALQIESAAEMNGVTGICIACEQFASSVSSFDCLDALEKALMELADLYFHSVIQLDFDPIILVNEYLQKNHSDQSLSVNSLSQHINFSTSYLCTIYKQRTGRTINTAITALRIEKACKLLCNTNLKLYEVANRVGYQDGKYFTKTFTKEVGITPRQYRDLHHEE